MHFVLLHLGLFSRLLVIATFAQLTGRIVVVKRGLAVFQLEIVVVRYGINFFLNTCQKDSSYGIYYADRRMTSDEGVGW